MTPASSRPTGQDAMSLLLLSNSATHARPYLAHALRAIAAHLSGRERLLFVPYALADHDGYTATVAEAMRPIGVRVEGLHRHPDPASAVGSAEAVFAGGGNTFRLLRSLRRAGLLGPLRDRVRAGLPYLGSSAGTNLACPRSARRTTCRFWTRKGSTRSIWSRSRSIRTTSMQIRPASTRGRRELSG